MLDFGNALRIRAYVSASGVFVESISNAEMRDSFGIVRLSGKLGEKRKHGKASARELEVRRQWETYFSFCQPERHDVVRRLTWSSTVAHR